MAGLGAGARTGDEGLQQAGTQVLTALNTGRALLVKTCRGDLQQGRRLQCDGSILWAMQRSKHGGLQCKPQHVRTP